jgi:hypothetical protein
MQSAPRFAVVALATFAVAGGPAAAAASAEPCSPASASKTFLPWLDVADYVPAPDGDLEAAGEWNLAGGAEVVEGNEPFHVGDPDDAASLSLPAGGSAETAPMCVGLEHPTLRFFARRESGSPFGVLRVEALVGAHPLLIGLVTGSGRWEPTLPLPIVLNSLALVDGSTDVSFRFSPLYGSRWSVDDVYVDPYRTN